MLRALWATARVALWSRDLPGMFPCARLTFVIGPAGAARSFSAEPARTTPAIHFAKGPVHHCRSQGTPSLLPSMRTSGQFRRKNVASAQDVICEQWVRPSQLKALATWSP